VSTIARIRGARVATVVAAVALPLFFTANAIRVLLTERYVRASYPHLAPDDVLTQKRRTELSLLGLRAVDPLRGGSVALLREPRLPSGRRAFTARELRHMRDVRTWLWRLLVFEVVVAAALAVAAVRSRRELARALSAGGVATVAVGALAIVAMVVDFDDVLLGFHKLLFEGESWHFRNQDTLIRVYPERFWNWTGIAMGVLVLAQALVAIAAGEAIRRAGRTRRA
jgi:integral membrane protein (TIGR01906 family)